jgi:hypothetical protein
MLSLSEYHNKAQFYNVHHIILRSRGFVLPPLLVPVGKNGKNIIRNEDMNEKLQSLTKTQQTWHHDTQHNDTLLKHSGIILAASSMGQGFKFCHHCPWYW